MAAREKDKFWKHIFLGYAGENTLLAALVQSAFSTAQDKKVLDLRPESTRMSLLWSA